MGHLDRTLFKAMNRLADRTGWAHGIVRFYAKDGVVVFAFLLLAGWWIGRVSTAPILGALMKTPLRPMITTQRRIATNK